MGKAWDAKDGAAFAVDFWREVLRVLKPGGHMLAFSGTRTYHRMVVAIDDAGFEIRDQFAWIYGSGFPKSLDVSKAIDKAAGAERAVLQSGAPVKRMIPGADQGKTGWAKDNGRAFTPTVTAASTEAAIQWHGWGTAVKPAWEPLCLARKPFVGTVAANVMKHGTGAMNIDGCRIETDETIIATRNIALGSSGAGVYGGADKPGVYEQQAGGRFPANIAHDGSDEVLAGFPQTASGEPGIKRGGNNGAAYGAESRMAGSHMGGFGDSGSAARFFYTAKADAEDRIGSQHPTVKPLDLIQYYCRLITPPGGVTLDPFAGTGTTGEAAWREGFRAILIEREPDFQADIARRMDLAVKPAKRAAVAKSKNRLQGAEGTPLFGEFLP
jgi:site-specific DNA-methyltransferase (adenine-specific)